MPLLPDTSIRRVEDELMDSPSIAVGQHHAALAGLARINTVSRSAATVWAALAPRLEARTPARVLDLACGGGDVAASLERRARRDGADLVVDGCDVSERAVEIASRRIRRGRAFRLDVLDEAIPAGYDAVVSNLFLHHLSRDDAARLLRRLSEAAPVIVINDLSRGTAGFAAAWLGTRLLSRSPVVHYDGPVSVRAAFTLAEARELATEAGLAGAAVRSAFPWRWVLSWSR